MGKRKKNQHGGNSQEEDFGVAAAAATPSQKVVPPKAAIGYAAKAAQENKGAEFTDAMKEQVKDYFQVDGSLLEGGGQVLRNGMAYAALLKKNIRIFKIRHNRRPKTGLRPQHLTGIKLCEVIADGTVENAYVGSPDIAFRPGLGIFKEKFDFEADIQTAGSICLLIQISLPVLMFLPSPSRVVLKGGTNAIKAPLIDYMNEVFLPTFRKHCIAGGGGAGELEVYLHRRGFFPRGGGMVELLTKPIKGCIPALDLTQRGYIKSVKGTALVCGKLPMQIADRMAKSATAYLENHLGIANAAASDSKDASGGVPIEISVVKDPPKVAPHEGCSILVVIETSTGMILGGSALGERGVSAEDVGKACAKELVADWRAGGCVDRWMQDQLIIWMALAQGKSRMLCGPLELHTRTAIHWAQELSGAKFTITENADKSVLVECVGIGYISRFPKSNST